MRVCHTKIDFSGNTVKVLIFLTDILAVTKVHTTHTTCTAHTAHTARKAHTTQRDMIFNIFPQEKSTLMARQDSLRIKAREGDYFFSDIDKRDDVYELISQLWNMDMEKRCVRACVARVRCVRRPCACACACVVADPIYMFADKDYTR
jgi:hypothetical protein